MLLRLNTIGLKLIFSLMMHVVHVIVNDTHCHEQALVPIDSKLNFMVPIYQAVWHGLWDKISLTMAFLLPEASI